MSVKIARYRAGWKPNTNQGRILFETDDNETKILNLSDPAEFAAIVTLLSSAGKISIDNGGIIWSGDEGIGKGISFV